MKTSEMPGLEMQKERAIRTKEAAALCGIGRTKFYSMLKQPGFPQGVRLGGSRVWLVSDLLTYLKAQAAKPRARYGR